MAADPGAADLRIIEYDLTDRQPFRDDSAAGPARALAAESPAALAAALGIRFAPTLAFFDAEGRELAERIVGYGSPDFYGAYLEQRIATARKRAGAG